MERGLFRNLVKRIVNFRLISPGFDGTRRLREMYEYKPASINQVVIYKAEAEPNTVERKAIAYLRGEGGDSQIVNFEDI